MEGRQKGKFIVIEGTDGSGKTVQFERLILSLPEGTKIGTLDFPQYNEQSSYFVRQYLTGKYGGDVGPYAASVLFAVDRFDVKLKTLQWIEEGRLIVSNRYVASNMAHQGAKIEGRREREKFYRWLRELEYKIFGLPKPDLNVFLYVPPEISFELIAQKRSREYLNGQKRDLHESDLEYQKRASLVYLEIAELFPDDFWVIECAPDGKLLSPEEIHEKVWQTAVRVLRSEIAA